MYLRSPTPAPLEASIATSLRARCRSSRIALSLKCSSGSASRLSTSCSFSCTRSQRSYYFLLLFSRAFLRSQREPTLARSSTR